MTDEDRTQMIQFQDNYRSLLKLQQKYDDKLNRRNSSTGDVEHPSLFEEAQRALARLVEKNKVRLDSGFA